MASRLFWLSRTEQCASGTQITGRPSRFRNTRVVRSFTFSPDSSRFVSGSLDENMRIWEVPGATIKQAKGGDSTGYGRWVTPVSFSHCGSYIVSKSHDMTVHTWNIQAGQPTYTALMEQKEQILSVGFSPDSSHIYPVSRDRMVYVWQRQSRKLEYTIAVFMLEDKRVVCGSKSGRTYVWDNDKKTHKLTGHDKAVYSTAVSPDCQTFASGDNGWRLMMWDASTGKQQYSVIRS
ncbi:WD-40 repeat-containing protein [Rhizoctonia solani]|uniref:WD-40 repeat-containing protein n=1 Tax=Rhizoctonia solani TaxID=456999 RepID=A0A8H8P5I3_9AGAM|nr:WD-40 repeat-containing protein [Rhizoctonia solani]QRW24276.1 WD-40 repeat-containing protein [Rhizoctonia solani]